MNEQYDPRGWVGKILEGHPDAPQGEGFYIFSRDSRGNYVGETTENKTKVTISPGAPIGVGYEKIKVKDPASIAAPKAAKPASAGAMNEVAKETFDPGKDLSMPAGESFGTKAAKGSAEESLETIAEAETNYANYQKGLAVASFLVDTSNAINAYAATEGQARLNIQMARNQANDALFRGRQAQADRQFEGYQAGQESLLAMAAQGQDVNGPGVQRIQGSLESMGIYNGMREEMNAIREALGFELEEINYDYQVDNARVARDNAIIGSALNTAVTLAVL